MKKGDVVVEFDGSQQDQNVISRTTNVRAADGDIVQTKATQKIDDEADAMSKMSCEYDLERAKLDASKAEVLSAIEGEKNRIQVGVSEGSLQTVKASINAHQVGHEADLGRLDQRKDKAVRDLEHGAGLSGHDAAARADRRHRERAAELPLAGLVRPVDAALQRRRQRLDRRGNRRDPGSFRRCTSTSSWKKWTAASCRLGQDVRIRVDAIPDKEFTAELDWISPIAALVFKGGSTPEKTFPARATI